MVAERLNLNADALLGPERKSDDFSRRITGIISELRRKGIIQDWNAGRQFGIWRWPTLRNCQHMGPMGKEGRKTRARGA